MQLEVIGRDLDAIGSNWTQSEVIGRNWSRLDAIGTNWTRLVVIGRNWSRLVVIRRDSLQLVAIDWYRMRSVAIELDALYRFYSPTQSNSSLATSIFHNDLHKPSQLLIEAEGRPIKFSLLRTLFK